MKIYAVLFLFFGVYLTVCIWIFLIITDSIRKISSQGFLRARQDFVKTVDRHLAMLTENKPVPEKEIVLLCKQMNNRKMKRYFLQRFIYFADKISNKKQIKEYFKTAFPYFREILKSQKNLHYSEKSYRLMILGEFRQDLDEINCFIMNYLEDESFDVRTNALRALSLIGNVGYFNKGLLITCNSEKYYNSRHISDMAGSFEGNAKELKQVMKESFRGSTDSYRYQVLVYLAVHTEDSVDFVLEYVRKHPDNKEIVIAGLRYFSVCEVQDRVKIYIWSLLSVEDPEIRAILVKLAPIYFYQDWNFIRLLLGNGFLGSRDWHVRRNSASALVRIGLDKAMLMKFMPRNDSYAREALVYAMLEDGIVTYKEMLKLGGVTNGVI